MKAVELFAGAGGLALGVSHAGFLHPAVIERDHDACETIRANRRRGVEYVRDWRIVESDVRQVDYSAFEDRIELVAGGPPCQPFSLGGKHGGPSDSRDMFPEAVRAIREIRPKAFLFENVRGLLRQSFAKYFEYILLRLTYPELLKKPGDGWSEHLSRLERHHTKGKHDGLSYRIVFRHLNSADYGVPQKRERVFIVGFRSDLGVQWSFPEPTHSRRALEWSKWVTADYWERHLIEIARNTKQRKWVTADYWERHRIPAKKRPTPRGAHSRQGTLFGSEPLELAWVTVRDAISGLPAPEKGDGGGEFLNHRLIPGARIYPGHTGSPLDEPAKTLKAGDHGVPGGENMLAFPDGRVRYFTVRESARLQCFPDEYAFHGSWTESMRQIGNAVPVILSRVVASGIRERLNGALA